jgi:5-methylcytosine-specific restriction endonuclease McrA
VSNRRVSGRAGWVRSDKLPKGPNGRNFCRWCKTEVPKGRRTFCSDPCVHEHKLRSDPGYVRDELFKRDVGICALCQADTEALRHELRKAWRDYPTYLRGAEWNRRREESAVNIPEKFRGLELSRSWWDADHIVPVVEGGGECGLEGYRTLCVPCHKEVTRELRARLAKARRTRQDAPETTQAATATKDADQPSEPPGSPGSGPARYLGAPRTDTTPGLRHDGVSGVRRAGPDAPVQGAVPSVSRARGDL